MKLVTFLYDGEERIGALDSIGRIVDLRKAFASWKHETESMPHADQFAAAVFGRDMLEFLQRGEKSMEAARKSLAHIAAIEPTNNKAIVIDPSEVHLMAPVPRPGAVISAGKNFSDHVAEMASKKGPAAPVAFLKLPGSVIGPQDDIPYPPEVENLDYEVEVAIVIGKTCVGVSEGQALDYVAGYSVFNDISARDIIRSENQTGIHLMGKSFPGFAPMGPYLVTMDEVPDPQKLEVEANRQWRDAPAIQSQLYDLQHP
jgi:acylpyruvate hydrolase